MATRSFPYGDTPGLAIHEQLLDETTRERFVTSLVTGLTNRQVDQFVLRTYFHAVFAVSETDFAQLIAATETAQRHRSRRSRDVFKPLRAEMQAMSFVAARVFITERVDQLSAPQVRQFIDACQGKVLLQLHTDQLDALLTALLIAAREHPENRAAYNRLRADLLAAIDVSEYAAS